MPVHSHRFVEECDGLIGFGFDRKGDEDTLTYYLQKFSDDENMALMRGRMSDEELEEVFNLISGLLKRHLSDKEYHGVFLKDTE